VVRWLVLMYNNQQCMFYSRRGRQRLPSEQLPNDKEWKQDMSYSVQNIRNVCLLGHGGNGKTAMAESLLYITGVLDRMRKAADGNTVCDYDPEEVKRQISISTAVAPVEYKGCKINILDTPGGFDFAGEVVAALR